MARTLIARSTLAEIRHGTARKDELLRALADGERDAAGLGRGAPSVTVTVEVLARAQRAKYEEPSPPELARGTMLARDWRVRVVDPIYELVGEATLHAMTDPDRLDVVRVGRALGQDIVLPEGTVQEYVRSSREHGLVILDGDTVLYCDYGTLRDDGTRAGSTNGTWLERGGRIRDAMITWPPGRRLVLGRTFCDRDGEPCYEIRMRYAHVGN